MSKFRVFCFTCLLPWSYLGCSAPTDVTNDGSLQGTLRLRVAKYDDSSQKLYTLELPDRSSLRLKLREATLLGSDTPVRVYGSVENGEVLVDSLEVVEDATRNRTAPRVASPLPEARTLNLLAVSLYAGRSQDSLKDRVFEADDSPRSFYDENSYGTWTLQGDALGPYAVTTAGCPFEAARDEANAAMTAAGVDWETADNIMYFLPSSAGCGWGGLAAVGTNPARTFKNAHDSWYISDDCVVLSQELGHNFGLLHSHICSGPPYTEAVFGGSDCPSFSEYGDSYTPMGGGCGHFNPIEAGALTFLRPCNTLAVTSSGTFELGPVEEQCNGQQILRVALGQANQGEQFFYVSYRKGAGTLKSDSESPQGLYVHAGPLYEGNPTDVSNPDYAVNISPFLLTSSPIGEGESWTEEQSSVEIKLVSAGDTASVELTFPAGDGNAPTCIDGSVAPDGPHCGEGGAGGSSGSGGAGGMAGSSGAGGAGGMAGGSGVGGAGGSAGTAGASGAGGSAGTAGVGGTGGSGAGGGNAGTGGGGAGSGGGGAGGSAGNVGGSAGGTDVTEGDGCGCRVPSKAPHSPWGAAGVLAALGLLCGRRARRQS